MGGKGRAVRPRSKRRRWMQPLPPVVGARVHACTCLRIRANACVHRCGQIVVIVETLECMRFCVAPTPCCRMQCGASHSIASRARSSAAAPECDHEAAPPLPRAVQRCASLRAPWMEAWTRAAALSASLCGQRDPPVARDRVCARRWWQWLRVAVLVGMRRAARRAFQQRGGAASAAVRQVPFPLCCAVVCGALHVVCSTLSVACYVEAMPSSTSVPGTGPARRHGCIAPPRPRKSAWKGLRVLNRRRAHGALSGSALAGCGVARGTAR